MSLHKIAITTLLFCTVSAQAGLFDDDEARRQIAQLQKESHMRLQQLESANRKVLDLVNHIEQIQNDLAKLSGQVDELSYNQKALQKQQHDLYLDVDTRLKGLQEKQQNKAQSDHKTLTGIVANIRAGKYQEAIASLQKLLDGQPSREVQGTLYYWLGMSQAGSKDFIPAQRALNKVIHDYPEDQHAADAMLALASIQKSQGQQDLAMQTLQLLVARYQHSSAALQAEKILKAK
jgi:TolA-binding protein